MPEVPGTPSYGYGGWGTSPYPGGSSGLYQWGLLIASGAIGLTAVGRAYRIIGLTSKTSRFLWSFMVGTSIGIAPPGVTVPSSGGGGPGEVLTSAAPPSLTSYRGGRLQGIGRTATTSLVGRRKGAKPRKRCPPGFRWDGRRCVRKG